MLSFIWLLIFSAYAERAKVSPEDVERLSGFAEHKKGNADFDRAREAGYLEYLKEKEAEEQAHKRAGKDQQAQPKQISSNDTVCLQGSFYKTQRQIN